MVELDVSLVSFKLSVQVAPKNICHLDKIPIIECYQHERMSKTCGKYNEKMFVLVQKKIEIYA